MKYYVVSDPHGFYTLLHRALTEKGFFEDEEKKKLIVLGDALDRGGEAERLVDFLLELKARGELIFVLGNHEELFTQALQEVARGGIFEIASGMSHHYRNGTWDSFLQLSGMSSTEAVNYPSELVRAVRGSRFYKELLPFGVDYYETENYVFCHGWLPSFKEGFGPYVKYFYDKDWRSASAEDWRCARWYNGMELSCRHSVNEEGKTIVCGHFHASYGHSKIDGACSEFGADADFTPFFSEGIIAIDSCAAASGFINCIVIED